jgi:hypothetical protein
VVKPRPDLIAECCGSEQNDCGYGGNQKPVLGNVLRSLFRKEGGQDKDTRPDAAVALTRGLVTPAAHPTHDGSALARTIWCGGARHSILLNRNQALRDVGFGSGREPQVRRDECTGHIRLILRGTSDARSSVDRDTRLRIVLPVAQAARLWQLLGDNLSNQEKASGAP